ncbi:hypothetical protein C7212DRAFT_216301, partial [Tuber magnatum]
IRFSKEEIHQILPYLKLHRIQWRYHYNPHPEEAFCILLYRLFYPYRLKNCLKIFGSSRGRLSVICNDLVSYLISRYAETLFWDKWRLTFDTLQRYVYANTIKCTSGLPGIWGFVDSTMRPFCHPGENQGSFYSGYKKCHPFKFQSIVTPDGLLSSLAGLFPGPIGDWVVWHSCGIVEILQDIFSKSKISEEERLYVYGDSAYSPVFGVMGPFVEQVNKPLT